MGGGISESRISSIDGQHWKGSFVKMVDATILAAKGISVCRMLGLQEIRRVK
jgi:hypothetical protein